MLQQLHADLPGLRRVIRPCQFTVNEVARHLKVAGARCPPYCPYPTADLRSEPWLVSAPDYRKASGNWMSRVVSMESSQKRPFPMRVLRLRLIMDGHMCYGWKFLGGVSTRLNYLAGVTNVDSLGNQLVETRYGDDIKNKLTYLHREREMSILRRPSAWAAPISSAIVIIYLRGPKRVKPISNLRWATIRRIPRRRKRRRQAGGTRRIWAYAIATAIFLIATAAWTKADRVIVAPNAVGTVARSILPPRRISLPDVWKRKADFRYLPPRAVRHIGSFF